LKSLTSMISGRCLLVAVLPLLVSAGNSAAAVEPAVEDQALLASSAGPDSLASSATPDTLGSPASSQPSAPAPGDASVAASRQVFKSTVARIDRRIMLECIKLARFNAQYHDGVNRKNFAQEWLYPMQREAGTALAFSNTIVDIRQRARGLKDPSLISRTAQKKGLECALIGQAITGTSSAVQLLQNFNHTRIATKNGFSPAAATATVKGFVTNIDAMLAERNRLVAAENLVRSKELYELQGRLLAHIKNQLLFEFKNWSVGSRFTEWSEDTFFAIDSAQGYTQMSSSLCSLQGFSKREYGGAAAITGLVGNALVTFNPIIRTAVGHTVARIERKRLDKIFPQGRPRKIDDVLAECNLTIDPRDVDETSSLETKELAFLIRRTEELDGPLDKEVQHVVNLRRIADQQAISGPLIGLAGVTRSVLNTVAYYQSTPSGSANYERTRVVSNQLNLSGRIVQSTGQAYSLMNTPYTEVKHFLYKRRLRKAGQLPKQLLAQRLTRLDELEKRVKASLY
jgi:hypothetical protein